MEQLISKMEEYALNNNIPIMQADGLDFMLDFIKKHEIKNILEIGAAIGYSAIRMCLVDPEIKVQTIERDEKRYNEAVKNIAAAGMNDRINIIHGDAFEVEIEGKYDLVFIDAAKAQYIKFFERYVPNLEDNGYIISDNLSFHGIVGHPERTQSRNVRQLVRKIGDYVRYLEENETFKTTFFELGDGVAITQYRKMDFDGFIFDMDGLLVDSETVARDSWQVACKRHGFEIPWSVYSKFLGRSLKDIKEIFEAEIDTDIDFMDFKAEVDQIRVEDFEANGVRLMPGCKELLDYLKSQNKKMIVATSSYQDVANKRLADAGILSYFDGVISGDMIEHSKPHPEIFEVAQRKLGCSKNKCVVLEDSNTGVLAANNAGIRVIMVPGLVEADEYSEVNNYMICKSLSDVMNYFKENK